MDLSTKIFITAKGQPPIEKKFFCRSLRPGLPGVAVAVGLSLSGLRSRPGLPLFKFLFSHNRNLTARGYGFLASHRHEEGIRCFISHPHFLLPPRHRSASAIGIYGQFNIQKVSSYCFLKPRSPGISTRQISSSQSDRFLKKSRKQELKVNVILNRLLILFWIFPD